jgi:hypothetical protein
VGAEEQAPATPPRGWLEAARSRLGNGISIVETSGETAAHGQPGRATPRNRELDDQRAEVEPGVRAHDALASERAALVDTPMTGASPYRVEGRARVAPAALVLGVAVTLGAGTWGGWKAWHSATTTLPASDIGRLPTPVAVIRPVEQSVATEVPSLSTPPAQTTAVGVEQAKLRDDLPAPTPERAAGGRRPAASGRPRASVPGQSFSNLDDVLFGTGDPSSQGRVAASTDRAGRPSLAAGSGRSVHGVPSLDDVVLGSDTRPPQSRTSTPEPAGAAATTNDDRTLRSTPRAK